MNDDPRLGKPSASSFGLDALCPGRRALLNTLPDAPEVKDEDADRGIRLHAAWEKERGSNLHLFEDPEEQEIYERGVKLVLETIEAWKSILPKPAVVQEGQREERFYLRDQAGEILASGQADRHYTSGDHVLVCDFKSLWCRNLIPAERNWQARLLTVLVAREYGARHVRFAFLKAMFNKVDIVDYTEEDINRAENSVQQILWEAKQSDAQRRPGVHCRWCKANASCPEAASWMLLPTARYQYDGITPTVAKELVEQITLENCAKVWKGITSRRNIEDAIKARLKALPPGILCDLGLQLGKPSQVKVFDAFKAFNFLLSCDIPAEKLWTAVKMNNSELVNIVQQALGMGSKKVAERWIADRMAGCMTLVPKEAALEEI